MRKHFFAEISKSQARLDALGAAVTTMNLRPAGTSPATRNAAGDTSILTIIALTVPVLQTKEAKESNTDNLNVIYKLDGKLNYTTSVFANLSKEYHPDLINLILYIIEEHEYFKMKTNNIANLC